MGNTFELKSGESKFAPSRSNEGQVHGKMAWRERLNPQSRNHHYIIIHVHLSALWIVYSGVNTNIYHKEKVILATKK